jgi:hypothetical protein
MEWYHLFGGIWGVLITIIVIILPAVFIVWLTAVGVLANRYGRNVIGYVLLSFIVTPPLVITLLNCLDEDKYKKAERFEEEWKFIKKILNEGEKIKINVNGESILSKIDAEEVNRKNQEWLENQYGRKSQ